MRYSRKAFLVTPNGNFDLDNIIFFYTCRNHGLYTDLKILHWMRFNAFFVPFFCYLQNVCNNKFTYIKICKILEREAFLWIKRTEKGFYYLHL